MERLFSPSMVGAFLRSMAYGSNYRELITGKLTKADRKYYDTRADDGKFSESAGGGGSKAKEKRKAAIEDARLKREEEMLKPWLKAAGLPC